MKEEKILLGFFCHSDLGCRCSNLYNLYADLISTDYSAVNMENHIHNQTQ